MPAAGTVVFAREDVDLILAFAGCSLDEKPGSNWVQGAGGLPSYICEVARAIKRSGKTTSQAIAIAVSRMKKWAAGVGVDKGTQAKAAKALAEWEKLRAKSHVKAGAKKAGKVAATNARVDAFLMLAASADYPVSLVTDAYRRVQNAANDAYYAANPTGSYKNAPGRGWVKEQWTRFLIVSAGYDGEGKLYKVPYSVDDKQNVTFEDPAEVKTDYVTVPESDIDDTGLSDTQLTMLAAAQPQCQYTSTQRLLDAHAPAESPLQRLLAFAAPTKPYGDVSYADPGYKDDKKRYPIDTAAHVRAAWSYINQKGNQADYSAGQLAAIKGRIKAAAKKLGVQISGD